jgi:hypothetical protein
MHPRAISRRGIGFGGRVAAAACIIYLGLVFPAMAANRIAPVRVSAIDSARPSSQLLRKDTRGSRQKTKHFPAARRISRRSIVRRTDLSVDDRSRNQTTLQFCIVDLDAVTLRVPEVTRRLRIRLRSFYCLQEHIRERAPPISENQI